jgi:hypothetical protein
VNGGLKAPFDHGLTHLSICLNHSFFLPCHQAKPEHSLVLIPNGDAEYCSLDASYTSYVDRSVAAPSLMLEVHNPRILLLFRFVNDAMQAADIFAAAAATRRHSAAPTPSPEAAALAAAAATAAGLGSQGPHLLPPAEIVVQLHNVGLVLPTSTKSRTVLAGQMDHLMLALPGTAIPDNLLREAQLPSIQQMMEDSVLSSRIYKFGGFHDDEADGGEGQSAAGGAEADGRRKGEGAAGRTEVGQAEEDGGAGPMGPRLQVTRRKVVKDPGSLHGLQPEREGNLATESGSRAVTAAATDMAKKRGGRAPGKRLEGVLFFEDDVEAGELASRKFPGVLRVGEERDAASLSTLAVAPDSELEADHPGEEDNVLALPTQLAKGVAVGIGRLFEGAVDRIKDVIDGADVDQPGASDVVMDRHEVVRDAIMAATAAAAVEDKEPSGTSAREPSLVAAASATASVFASAARDAARARAAVEARAPSSGEGDSQRPALQSTVAVCIEDFVLSRGLLVRMPSRCARASPSAGLRRSALGAFAPHSLASFIWPTEVFDVVQR